MKRSSAQRMCIAAFSLFSLVAAACGSDTVNSGGQFDEVEAAPSTVVEESTIVDASTTGVPVESTSTTEVQPEASTSTGVSSTTTEAVTTTVPVRVGCANQIPLDQRVGQLMFPVITQPEFAAASELASAGLLGGVVVLGAPTSAISADIANYQSRSLFGDGIIAVDEEGGRVQRLTALTSALPSARIVSSTLTPDEARQLAADHALAIGELGFTMNLAPVVDLDNGIFIGDRSFGSDPAAVTEYAFATAQGILDAGLVPVLKHFPGHGRGIDSHTGLPTIPGVEVLSGSDLVPFVAAADRDDLPIMVGHLVVEGLTGDLPASISGAAIDGLLRTELGFDGLVMTDAFNMDAISATLNNAQAAERSLAAGVDLIMLGSLGATAETVAVVVEAVSAGRIDETSISESFVRVMETRGIDPCSLGG